MDYQLYGFLIGEDIRFDIESRRLYRFAPSIDEKNFSFCAVYLNDTMMQLFLYLLIHARKQSVIKDELFKHVWEKNNLSPSSQRLWQVTSKLNKQLTLLGLPDDFIKNIKGAGYIINYEKILPLYFSSGDIALSPQLISHRRGEVDEERTTYQSAIYAQVRY